MHFSLTAVLQTDRKEEHGKSKECRHIGQLQPAFENHGALQHVAGRASDRYGIDSVIYDMVDVGPSLGTALWRKQLDDRLTMSFKRLSMPTF
jgi:hypothetical protein